MTLDELRKYIQDNLIVDLDELPLGRSVAWFNNPSTGQPTMIEFNSPLPFDTFSTVIAIFQTDHAFRVYTLPGARPDPVPNGWRDRAPTRFTLSKTAPTYCAEVMSLEAMARAIVDESNALAGGEADLILEYIEEQDPVIDRDKLLAELRADAHLEPTGGGDEEEEEEPEGDEPERPTTPPPPPPAPPAGPPAT